MKREEAIEIIKNLPIYRAEMMYGGNSDLMKALVMACEALGAIDQTRWERDIAISQLEELGLGFGEKTDKVKEAIEKQIPKKAINGECPVCGELVERWDWKYCVKCGQAL